MCLYPTLIRNPKYKPNKKNGGNPPQIKDIRTTFVPIGCKKCIECTKQRGQQWKVRLSEHIKTNRNGIFVTLTFSTESLKQLTHDLYEENGGEYLEGYALDNAIATLATRRFLERWRKKYKKSLPHWLITELGHGSTEHVHIHGIVFTDHKKDINQIWKYGYTFTGDYVNERTVNYVMKYVTKIDFEHKEYIPIILTSPGIGRNYVNRLDAKLNKFNPKGTTKETYTTSQGIQLNMPIYYRNKIYTEAERELLWIQKLDKQERWVCGTRIDISTQDGMRRYDQTVKYQRSRTARLGYAIPHDYKQKQYEHERRKLIHATRGLRQQTK